MSDLSREVGQDLSEGAMKRRCIAISLLQEYMKLPSQPCLVPSADGALDTVVLTIPAYALKGQGNPLWKVYADLILKLPGYTKLQILTHRSRKKTLQQWVEEQGLAGRVGIAGIPDNISMTIWAEDDFELVHDKGGKLFMVQPHSNRRTADELASYYAGREFGWERVKVPVYFEGGNILVGDDFFFLGANYAVDTFHDLGELLVQDRDLNARKVITALYQQYLDQERTLYLIGSSLQLPAEEERSLTLNGEQWKERLYVKNSEGTVQPIFHIDMFITLAGRNGEGKYQVLVGDPRMASGLLGNNTCTWATTEAFDDIAETLRKLGFEVIRNPLPLTYVDDENQKVRKWYFATSNNALVEVQEGKKTVWLPSYGHGNWQELRLTDDKNREIWESLGFEVVMLEDFHPFAEFSGATHCIKKYLRRG
ncbi:MAG: hypothetical protein LPK07_16005 [Hymenobacteraceae bacterium]|nr:hypothetical protein [Hymenobacteraceae bacterium]